MLRHVRKRTIIEQVIKLLEEYHMKIKKLVSLALAVVLTASFTLTGCGKKIDEDAVVAKLDDKEISLGLANFMAQYTAASYDGYYLDFMGDASAVVDMWTEDMNNTGTTMEMTVKNGIMEQLQTGYLLEQHMEDYGVTITDEELAAMEQAADEFLADNSDKAIKLMGAKKEYITEMLRLHLIQKKMQDAIFATVDTEVSDEEAAQRTISYFRISDQGYYDEENNYIQYTDEEKAGIEETAAQVAKDAAEDFDAAAADYNVNTYSYGADEIGEDGTATGTLDAAVIEAADKLEEGEVSEAVKVEGDAYYIIRLDAAFDQQATDEKKSEIASQRQQDEYTKVCDAYKEAADWSVDEDVWKTVNFNDIYSLKEEDTEAVTDTES